jgi:hypothetical protein
MTHTVEGWAVQYRGNNHAPWQWDVTVNGVRALTHTEAKEEAKIFSSYKTRIVRVRQTTEVIDE